MKMASSKTYAAHVSAGADAESALAAAEETGEVATELRVLRWMLGSLFGLQLLVLAAVLQIVLRLPSD